MVTDIFGAPDGGTPDEIENQSKISKSPREVRIQLGTDENEDQEAETFADARAIGAV
jgi:hypothetical protein